MTSRTRFVAFLALASALPAQTIPGRYVVELVEESAAVLQTTLMSRQAGRRVADVANSQEVALRRAAIATAQQRLARAVGGRGGRVLGAVDTALNALFVEISDAAAASLRQLPGVLRVTQERRFRPKLDRVLTLSKVPDAWTKIGGASKAGEGMRIAILDTGIDSSHPGFQDESLTPPDGFPKASGANNEEYLTDKVIVVRSYEDLAQSEGYGEDAADKNGHGTNAACASACIIHAVNSAGMLIAGAAPKAFLGAYKVLGNTTGGSTSVILKAVDDAMKDGFDVLNLSLGSDTPSDPADDPEVKALNAAVDAGYIVVVAAGNAGPDENTMNSPGTAEKVITVGSSSSDRKMTEDGPEAIDPNRISTFSSRGPNPGVGLKPDMLAVGDNFLTAQTSHKGGESYTVTQGTSFATPTVAGAAATLKGARPGLTALQYHSLLINTSSEITLKGGNPAPIRHQGAGRLDLLAALDMPVAIAPASVKFGIGGDSAEFVRELTISNLWDEQVTVELSVRNFDERTAARIVGPNTIELAGRGTAKVALGFGGSKLSGEYQGVVLIRNNKNRIIGRVPYWYGARSTAKAITLLEFKEESAAGAPTTFGVRVVDESGIDVADSGLKITTETEGAKVSQVAPMEGSPGVISVELVLAEGENTFVFTAGAARRVVQMTGN